MPRPTVVVAPDTSPEELRTLKAQAAALMRRKAKELVLEQLNYLLGS